jgi:hypothetical protein
VCRSCDHRIRHCNGRFRFDFGWGFVGTNSGSLLSDDQGGKRKDEPADPSKPEIKSAPSAPDPDLNEGRP